MEKKLYKLTGKDGETYNRFKWPLPKNGKPGAWTPATEGELIACKNGYHLTDFEHVLEWANEEMYEVEYKGKLVPSDDGDKYVVRQARLTRRVDKWNDKTLHLFAVWCAREALNLVGAPDPRSIAACDVTERYANGKATIEELSVARDAARAAACDAAWAAARAVARDAARDAARAAAWAAACYAACDAACYAACYTACDAAWAAARAVARDAPLKHLKKMLGL